MLCHCCVLVSFEGGAEVVIIVVVPNQGWQLCIHP